MSAFPLARLKFVAVFVAAALAAGFNVAQARAADDMDTLSDRMDRLQRDLRDPHL